MKHIVLVSILFVCFSVSLAEAQTQTEDRASALVEAKLKLKELALLPEGLTVSHTPDPVLYTENPPSLSGVKWEHSTTVSSMSGPLIMVEFGYFVQRNGQWEYPYGVEVPYAYVSRDFAEKYDCPDSKLLPGKSYTDVRNRSVIDCVPEQVVKWYFIGEDAKGNRVKGEASVQLVTELAE